MCNFFSALAISDGTIRAYPEATDSHTDLINWLGLSDVTKPKQWCKIEFVPPPGIDMLDLESWRLLVDETDPPIWWTDKREMVHTACKAAIQKMFVTDHRKILLGGCWILVPDVEIDFAQDARIFAMFGSATIYELCGRSAVVKMYDTSKIEVMKHRSNIARMRGQSNVHRMIDDSSIDIMYDDTYVNQMFDNTNIGHTRGCVKIQRMQDHSFIDSTNHKTQIGEMLDEARIHVAYDYTVIHKFQPNSHLILDKRDKM